MKKKISIIFITILIFSISIYLYIYQSNKHKSPNYEMEKTAINQNNNSDNNKNTNIENSTNNNDEISYLENELASFSTKIYSTDSARQNNIQITCNLLNGYILSNEETFSFCDIIGPSTSSKGYQESDIYDKYGNKTKGLGGGNCQVSTTLYNTVLAIPELSVTERHKHSGYVPYVQEDKDAAVAYGSYDFKFVNHTGNSIKIYLSTDSSNVSARIVKLLPSE